MVKNTYSKRTVVNHNYSKRSYNENGYQSFAEFYPFYLGEHCNKTNRRLHLIGTTNSALLGLLALLFSNFFLLPIAMVQAYAFAWVGHFFFENNKPATFKHPIYSLMGDLTMWYEVISGQRAF